MVRSLLWSTPMAQVGATEPPPPEGRRRILFVDDDPLILRSIARTIRASEPEWTVLTCEDPAHALELIEASYFESPIDVVVSDLNMKGLDGADLLVEVQRRRPEVVRIVLSATIDSKQMFRTAPVAHQFIAKPFEVNDLRGRLRAALALGDLLRNPRLRGLVAADNALPIAPSAFAELSTVATNPRTSVADLARVVEKDVALSAELIRLMSSAFLALPRQIHGIRGAIAYLGVEMLKALVLKVEMVRAFQTSRAPEGFNIEALQTHSVMVARSARRLLAGSAAAEDAFSSGILHDVGQLVLASRAPEEFGRAIAQANDNGISLSDAERDVFGVSHAEVGAYLLGLWGLRQPLIEAVALHHDPARIGKPVDVVSAVHLADSSESDDVELPHLPGLASVRPSGFLRTRLQPDQEAFVSHRLRAGGSP